jgi:two-component system LytT family sensor kinase
MQQWRANRALVVLGCLGAALLVAMLDASRVYFANVFIGRPSPWLNTFRNSAPSWLIVGLLAPLPLFFARVVSIDRQRWRSSLAFHVAGAIFFSAVHAVLLSIYLSWPTFASFAGVLSKTSSAVIVDWILYAAIAGVAHALSYYRQARERDLAASQLQARLTEARLDALRGQLNPHFLFNTLNAISTLALEGHKDQVVRTLGHLSDLLRASLDDGRPQEVTLDEELDLLERYLAIQRIRHGDRLTVRVDADPQIRSALVPGMILQPLVENAITHGVARVPGNGTVGIRAWREAAHLRLEVTDTGPGFGPAGSAAVARPHGTGIGLANTRARLAQLYGDSHRFDTHNAEGGGGCVSLTLPYRTHEPK